RRHARIVDEAAFYHQPADGALQTAEHEDAEQRPGVAARDSVAKQEPQVRREERDADRAAQQPMSIFPPEDALERTKRHVAVDVAEFRRRLILRERIVPV